MIFLLTGVTRAQLASKYLILLFWHLKEIKKDLTYFGKSYKRAHLMVDIAGLTIDCSVSRIHNAIQSYSSSKKAIVNGLKPSNNNESIMSKDYDTSWNLVKSNKGNLPIDDKAFERKYKEWETRNWPIWLKDNISFPFTVERMEDEDDAYFTDVAKHQPFRLGHTMKVIGIESEEDDRYGVIVQVREARRKGYVPLCDLEVTSRKDRNFWPVREYAVWSANR